MLYKKSILIDSDGVMYLTFGSLIEEHITTLNNITLEKVMVKPYGFDKMYMDKELLEDKLYQIIDKFSVRKIASAKFYSIF